MALLARGIMERFFMLQYGLATGVEILLCVQDLVKGLYNQRHKIVCTST